MKILIIIILLIMLSGCRTYEFLENSSVTGEQISDKQKAYVINPELQEEYEILKKSEIYLLTEDSTVNVKIKLNPKEVILMCGNLLTLPIFTLGLVPGSVNDQYIFSFIEYKNNQEFEREVTMKIRMSMSLYEIFFTGSKNDQIAEGVKEAYYKN